MWKEQRRVDNTKHLIRGDLIPFDRWMARISRDHRISKIKFFRLVSAIDRKQVHYGDSRLCAEFPQPLLRFAGKRLIAEAQMILVTVALEFLGRPLHLHSKNDDPNPVSPFAAGRNMLCKHS